MHYICHAPAYPLSDFVEFLWCLTDGPTHSAERILPCATPELVVNLRDDEICICDPTGRLKLRRFTGAVFSGLYSPWFDIDASRHTAMLGVHFKPGGAGTILGTSPYAVLDTHVDLDQLWDAEADSLRARVCEAASLADRFCDRQVRTHGTAAHRPPPLPGRRARCCRTPAGHVAHTDRWPCRERGVEPSPVHQGLHHKRRHDPETVRPCAAILLCHKPDGVRPTATLAGVRRRVWMCRPGTHDSRLPVVLRADAGPTVALSTCRHEGSSRRARRLGQIRSIRVLGVATA